MTYNLDDKIREIKNICDSMTLRDTVAALEIVKHASFSEADRVWNYE